MTPASNNKDKNKKQAPSPGFPMAGVDVEQLERLLDFMASHGLEEFEYEHAGLHIRLRKAPAAPAAAPAAPRAVASEITESLADASASDFSAAEDTETTASPAAPAATPAKPAEDLHIVKSPIVGTFYAASSPEAAPFVAVGDVIQEGKVICIIEAMKLMNEIESDVSGEIVRILTENGQPVEYGQSLFAIRAAKSKKK